MCEGSAKPVAILLNQPKNSQPSVRMWEGSAKPVAIPFTMRRARGIPFVLNIIR
jgi:hypothetical protein